MSKNSPLNFGMMGAAGLTMAQRVQNAQNAPGGLAANMNNMFMFGGGYAQQQQQQQMMDLQMQAMQNAQNQAQETADTSNPTQAVAGLGYSVNQGLGGVAGSINQGLGGAAAAENNATEAAQTQYQLPAYLGNPYADGQSNTTTAGMAVGDAPVATASNFNPETQFAAKNIFGRQKFRRKPLINL